MANEPLVPPDFEVGRAYLRKQLHRLYGGQRQGGISTPKSRPFLLLFTGTGARYGYLDGWDAEGVFRYSGEGQLGDMKFTGGNGAIRDAAQNGKDLHLFEQLGKGGVRYVGCFSCSSWEHREAKDKTGEPRQAIVFHLVPIDEEPTATSPPLRSGPSLDELRKRAFESGNKAKESKVREAKHIYRERCEAIRAYVLARANGVCEACEKTAPFIRSGGSPYLEPHHTRRLSDGGPDHPRWVAAICPNCHRNVHHGADGEALNRSIQHKLGRLEAAGEPS